MRDALDTGGFDAEGAPQGSPPVMQMTCVFDFDIHWSPYLQPVACSLAPVCITASLAARVPEPH